MIKIRTQPHTEFAARHLVNQLAKLGHQSIVVPEVIPTDKSLYIIYNSHELGYVPTNWICMQTEVTKSHWFNAAYKARIKKALAVWDYSIDNQAQYEHPKKFIVTPGISPQPSEFKDIPYLFYGWIEGSERRKNKLIELEAKLQLVVVTSTLNSSMWDILKRTQTVINIHYYDNSPPELYRICESISYGCKVWMHDEDMWVENYPDNLEELKTALTTIL